MNAAQETWFDHEKLEVYREAIEFIAWLSELLEGNARLGYQSHFFARTDPGMEDDHIPFVKRGVPSADLIDFGELASPNNGELATRMHWAAIELS